jgi:hypothetical protein
LKLISCLFVFLLFKKDYFVLLVDADVAFPAAIETFLAFPNGLELFAAPPAAAKLALPFADAGTLVVFPCANTGAAIATINDTAATIDTIAIKFNLDMHR